MSKTDTLHVLPKHLSPTTLCGLLVEDIAGSLGKYANHFWIPPSNWTHTWKSVNEVVFCPECDKHPDLPLLALANIDEDWYF